MSKRPGTAHKAARDLPAVQLDLLTGKPCASAWRRRDDGSWDCARCHSHTTLAWVAARACQRCKAIDKHLAKKAGAGQAVTP